MREPFGCCCCSRRLGREEEGEKKKSGKGLSDFKHGKRSQSSVRGEGYIVFPCVYMKRPGGGEPVEKRKSPSTSVGEQSEIQCQQFLNAYITPTQGSSTSLLSARGPLSPRFAPLLFGLTIYARASITRSTIHEKIMKSLPPLLYNLLSYKREYNQNSMLWLSRSEFSHLRLLFDYGIAAVILTTPFWWQVRSLYYSLLSNDLMMAIIRNQRYIKELYRGRYCNCSIQTTNVCWHVCQKTLCCCDVRLSGSSDPNRRFSQIKKLCFSLARLRSRSTHSRETLSKYLFFPLFSRFDQGKKREKEK